MCCFLVLRFFLHPVMAIKYVVILSAMYSWIVWIEFGSSYRRRVAGKNACNNENGEFDKSSEFSWSKGYVSFAMVFGETLCGHFLLKFWRKRTRLPCMGPTESLHTLSPVVLAKVSVAQAFWRKILHIFTTGVGELFAHFRQSFWRNHLLACTISLSESC